MIKVILNTIAAMFIGMAIYALGLIILGRDFF